MSYYLIPIIGLAIIFACTFSIIKGLKKEEHKVFFVTRTILLMFLGVAMLTGGVREIQAKNVVDTLPNCIEVTFDETRLKNINCKESKEIQENLKEEDLQKIELRKQDQTIIYIFYYKQSSVDTQTPLKIVVINDFKIEFSSATKFYNDKVIS